MSTPAPALIGKWRVQDKRRPRKVDEAAAAEPARPPAAPKLAELGTITDRFDADGVGQDVTARPGDTLTFSVTGRFNGLVVLEQWSHGGPRRRLVFDAPGQGTFTVAPMDLGRKVHFRFRMEAHAKGAAITQLSTELG